MSADEPQTSQSFSWADYRPPEHHLRDLIANLRAGLALLLFRPSPRDGFKTSAESIALLVALVLTLRVVFDALMSGFNAWFAFSEVSQLPALLFPIPLIFLAGLLVSKISRERGLALQLPVALLSVLALLQLPGWAVYLATFKWMPEYSAEAWTYVSWTNAATWLIAFLLCCRKLIPARRFQCAALGIAILALPLTLLKADLLWAGPESYDESDDNGISPASEDVLYSQDRRLNEALRPLVPGRHGIDDLYFLGAGLYSTDDVFMKEVQAIGKLFQERFDTKGRSVLLINNRQTLESTPLATATSVRRSLARIGEAMNRDDDILFLYLTSHGSKGHELSVDFWPLQLNQIDPGTLKGMLDESGIKWRVIVVSACYAGGFIEPLKNDTTMIATAADANHVSFGCGDDFDFTYFGRAYFDEELRHSFSFIDAFGRAQTSIQEREEREGVTHSNPQLFVGDAIRPKLEELRRRLESSELRNPK